jgi:hypothetical protein
MRRPHIAQTIFACSRSAQAIAEIVSRFRHTNLLMNAFELSRPAKPNYLED